MFKTPLRLALAVFAAAVLSACGQQGPLYLPDDPPPMPSSSICPTCAQAPPATDEAPETEATETDDEDVDESAGETLESHPEPISNENNE